MDGTNQQIIIPDEVTLSRRDDEADSLMAIIARAAANPAVDVDKLERLLGMRERVQQRQAEIDFNEALARVSPLMPRIKRNGEVSYAEDKNVKNGPMKKAFNFALWEDVDSGIRPIISTEGFTLSWDTQPRSADGGGCIVTGKLSHVGGHSRTASISLALDTSGGKNNLQAMASTISYGKRYTAFMLLNIVTEGEDDDGNAVNAITIEEAAAIDVKLNELKADKPAFLKYMGVSDVRNILAKDHAKATAALRKKEKANAK